MVTKLLTTINDREILDGQIDTFIDVSGASDRYLVESTVDGDITVEDFDGGVIVLPAGLTLEDVQVASGGSAVQLTVNGSTITYTSGGAGAAFSVVLGGSNENLAAGETMTASEFADLFDAEGPGAVVGADGTLGDGSVDPGPGPSDDLELTTGQDSLVGTDGDDVFTAPIVQNQLGAVTNSFESGDSLDGGAGRNILEADITASVSGTIPIGPAISASTENIQEVYLRHQFPVLEVVNGNNVGLATIDAENMNGVEQWWSTDSRNTIVLEDVRSNSADTTFGFRNSDPSQGTGGNNPGNPILATDFQAFFSPEALLGIDEAVDSTLTYTVFEDNDLPAELANISVFQLRFILDGTAFTLSSPEIEAANTYVELADAVNAELIAQGLDNVTAAPVAGQPRITLTDADAGTFEDAGVNSIILGFGNTSVTQNAAVGAPVINEQLIETNIVLDNVGRSSEGGSMIVGSMSTRGGVEVFDVTVQRSSWLQSLDSTNNVLEEVYVESALSDSNYLNIGTGTESNAGLNNQQRVPTTTDNRLSPTGLTDVRLFDATAFTGELKLGASLTNNIFDKYLADAEDTVEFEYLFGDNDTNFTLVLNEQIARDSDFALSIVGGAGDDRFNLAGNTTKSSTSIDGGEGFNIVEVTTTTDDTVTVASTGASQAFGEFLNVDRLVVAGNTGTTQNIVTGNMDGAGLSSIVIATNGAATNTTIERMLIDTELTVSGKNFTVGPNNNNMNQSFGVINIAGVRELPGDTVLEVKIENTARFDGVLTINQLSVTDENPANTSGADSVVLESAGVRDTLNRVSDFNAIRTADLTLIGTQAMGINVTALGATPGVSGSLDTTIDASDLGGRLTLAVNANGVLNNSDDDVLIGTTASMNDQLALYGVGADLDTTVSGLESIQFGWLASGVVNTNRIDTDTNVNGPLAFDGGRYDALNTSDVSNYIIGNVGGGGNTFELVGLRNNDTVTLGDATGDDSQIIGNAGQTITLEGNGTLNINALDVLDAANFGALALFDVSGVETINADIARPADELTGATVNYNIPFVGDNAVVEVDGGDIAFVGNLAGVNYTSQPALGANLVTAAAANEVLLVDNTLQNINLTGGSAVAGSTNVDNLVFTDLLPASLNSIDLSGFNGNVTFTLENAVQQDPTVGAAPGDVVRANDDVRVTVQSLYDMTATLTNPAPDFNAVDFNTIFEFTGAPANNVVAGTPTATWTIDNFVAGGAVPIAAGASSDNFTILDVSALGITDFAALTVVDDGTDTTITSEAQGTNPTWEIVLLGVIEDDLGISENFVFAS
ncbi:beta strand repeat-containing protein [Polycyclovorans algicola]|uniref:beta strand repeat-containing protein n=1 Tax=Polycyclovorans algicola TaxID=616992 RepID=UPI0004A774BC|nr:hypothetical protein [Polycyclovorans algicola]